MSRRARRAGTLAVAASVLAGCTLVVGDGKYFIVSDAGSEADSEATSADGGRDAPPSADEAGIVDSGPPGPCEAGARRCTGDGGIEACQADGGWDFVAACSTGTCAAASCVGATVTAPSCATPGPGRTNCGSDGGESCCLSEEIPGGTYYRTYDGGVSASPATISPFRLDKYLVTVGRFREFYTAWTSGETVDGGSGKHVHLNGGKGLANAAASGKYESGWSGGDDGNVAPNGANADLSCSPYGTWTQTPGAQENLPMNCLDWFQAYAFCIWDGGFLPSEAEMGYAAAGGGAQRAYPWGSAAPGTANQYAIYGNGLGVCYYPSQANCAGVANIAPVGTPPKGAGLWGQVDLGGEVNEWGLDWYSGSYVTPCTDCAYLNATGSRVLRGGAYKYGAFNFEWDSRFGFPVYSDAGKPQVSDLFGVRCARVP